MNTRLIAAASLVAAALLAFRPRRRSGVRLTWWLAVRESDAPRPTTGCNQTLRHTERGADVSTTITTTQEAVFRIQPKDRKGHPAAIDGVPEWLTNNSDVVHLHVSPDGLECRVVANGIPGTAQVQVTVDANVGEGVESLVGTAGVSVIPAPATTIDLADPEVREQGDEEDHEHDEPTDPVGPVPTDPAVGPGPSDPTEEPLDPVVPENIPPVPPPPAQPPAPQSISQQPATPVNQGRGQRTNPLPPQPVAPSNRPVNAHPGTI